MTKCTHTETCEECHEALRKEKAMARIKNELRSELNERLGVSHLVGETQLRAALRRLDEVGLTARSSAASPIGFADAVEG